MNENPKYKLKQVDHSASYPYYRWAVWYIPGDCQANGTCTFSSVKDAERCMNNLNGDSENVFDVLTEYAALHLSTEEFVALLIRLSVIADGDANARHSAEKLLKIRLDRSKTSE